MTAPLVTKTRQRWHHCPNTAATGSSHRGCHRIEAMMAVSRKKPMCSNIDATATSAMQRRWWAPHCPGKVGSYPRHVRALWGQFAPCSFGLISRINSDPAVFFSHNKPANSVFSTINQRNEHAVGLGEVGQMRLDLECKWEGGGSVEHEERRTEGSQGETNGREEVECWGELDYLFAS
jgi:hypothetical protein